MENDIADFEARFKALLEDAKSHGLVGAVVLSESDPLRDTESKAIVWRGGAVHCMGLLQYGANRIMHGLNSGEFDI